MNKKDLTEAEILKEIWYGEHLVPDGQKHYSITKPINLDHFSDCMEWWSGQNRKGRVECERAWKVRAEEIKARGYNLDIRLPHTEGEDYEGPEALLQELNVAEACCNSVREQLKPTLTEAVLR